MVNKWFIIWLISSLLQKSIQQELIFHIRYLRLLQLCQNADHGDFSVPLCRFLLVQDNKIHCLNVLRRSFQYFV